jgi:hypothetical protein
MLVYFTSGIFTEILEPPADAGMKINVENS